MLFEIMLPKVRNNLFREVINRDFFLTLCVWTVFFLLVNVILRTMPKILIFFFFIVLTCFEVQSQNIEVIGGLNSSRFHDFVQDEGHFRSSYSPGLGCAFRIGIDDIQFE